MFRLRLFLQLITVSLLSVPSCAYAATFGADLNNAPNVTLTCGQGVPPLFVSGIGSQSCMYFSGAPGPSPYAPASGTVAAVHVRVGAVTGPMQVVILRSLYQNKAGDPGHPYFACCFVERYGPIFTPQANTVTTVATNLPMIEEPTPAAEDFSTNAAGDFLALSVLDSNVPIPAFEDGQSGYTAYYPAPSEGMIPAPAPNPLTASTDGFGAQILLSADLESSSPYSGKSPASGGDAPGGAITPPATNLQPTIPSLAFPKLTLPVNNGRVLLPLRCAAADCVGRVLLQSVEQRGARIAKAKKHKPKTTTYGSGAIDIKAGAKGTVGLRLTAQGNRAAREHKRLPAWANFTFGAVKLSKRITLTR